MTGQTCVSIVPVQKLMHIAHTPCSCLILVVLEHCIHMVFCFTVVCLYSQYYSHASVMYTTLAKFPVSLNGLSIHKFKDGTNKVHNPCDCTFKLVTDNEYIWNNSYGRTQYRENNHNIVKLMARTECVLGGKKIPCIIYS